MHHNHILYGFVVASSQAVALTASSSGSPCPLAGPDFLAPKNPTNSTAVQDAVTAFQSAVASALKNSSGSVALDSVGTTFSFETWSSTENEPIFTYNYDASGLANPTAGVAKVDSDTIYRIGSLSKLLTVYTWLATDGYKHWNAPITEFVPELAAYDATFPQSDSIDIIHWSDITIGALASQLSGLEKDIAVPAAIYAQSEPYPLPASPDIPANATGLACDTYFHTPCTRANFINAVLATHPVYAPFNHPIYSNMAYSLLAFALENITSTPFPELLASHITNPLNLTDTTYYAPNITSTTNAIIPFNDTAAAFTANFSLLSPAGGYYSTLNDLTRIGRSILSSALLSTAQTAAWMKPAAFISDGVSAVGAPWEIAQAQGTNKTVYMYTKSGDIGLYASFLILFPDYDTGFSILAAGAESTATTRVLADIAMNAFAPAFEAAAKEEAATNFAGQYAGSAENLYGNGTNTFEVTLTTDDFAGMGITNYTVNGVDVIEALAEYYSEASPADMQLRLYPSGLTAPGPNGATLQGFRMVSYIPASEQLPKPGQVFTSNRCLEWFNVGSAFEGVSRGANGGLDEFAFVVGMDGQVSGLEIKTWSAVLQKA